jgi:chemotaxis protein MotA
MVDLLSLFGLFLGIGSILLGQFFEGGHMASLINGPAALIVFGGTLGAVMLQTPIPVFIRSLRMLPWIFVPPRLHKEYMIEKLLSWSNIARKEGLLGLENIADNEEDLFVRKGLELLIDGSDPDILRDVLELELDAKEEFDGSSTRVYQSMGGYAPTIGIIGAVMGLIHVMSNLSDPSSLGGGISVAFVATIYGVGLANLILIPISVKLRIIVAHEVKFREMIVEGLCSIAEGENPRNIERKLDGYLDKSINKSK